VERDLLTFETIDAGATSLRDARKRDLDRAVEQVRAVGDARAKAAVERVDDGFAEAAARSLVRARGVRVPVAQDGGARGEGGLDHLDEVLPPVGDHEKQLGARLDVFVRVEQGFPEVQSEGRTSGLPGRHDGPPPGPEPVGRTVQLGRFPATLDPLKRQEKPAFHVAGFLHAEGAPAPERGWHAVRILIRHMSVLTPDPSSPEGAVGVSGRSPRRLLVFIGVLAGLLAVLSVVDMFMPKAYDGVVPDPYSVGGIVVRDLVPGGAAEKAGLRAGDTVLGIGHRMLNKAAEAPPELRRHGAGETVDYLVRRGGEVFEAKLVLTPFRLGSATYFYFAFLGLLFFVLGAFVVSRRADDPAVQVFYVLCILFMLFFICRLRPSSYYWIDYVVQVAGTLALFLLPAVFLHFFLLFPAKKTFRFAERAAGEAPVAPGLLALQRFLNGSPLLFTLLYTLPPILYVLQMAGTVRGGPRRLIYGAPTLNWILLADYLILGLLALAHTWWTSEDRAARRPILVLLLGTVAGIVPFVVFAVFFPSLFREDRYLAWGVVPMAIIPLTFAYAIVRFRLFDVEVIVRKSLVYAILTAVVTGLYALCVVAGNALVSTVSSSTLFSAPSFAFGFGLVVVLLFDPLRRRMQSVVDRVFFRDRADFQRALLEMSRSVVSQLERPKLRTLLTSRTAELLRLESLDLLLPRGEDGAFTDGTTVVGAALPALPMGAVLPRLVLERGAPVRLAELEGWMLDVDSRAFVAAAKRRPITVVLPLATHGKLLGLLAVGRKRSEEELSREDLDHLLTIANQGALGLEAAGLHEELTRRAEMERDLDIAREIQTSLFPRELPRVPGVSFFGVSRPARIVGGDFYDFLEVDGDVREGGRLALVVGDVSGKSIPASLLMVAAKEIVYARAMADPDPGVVFRESNRRLYDIKRRMFVSLAYFLLDPKTLSLNYAFGGQPTPLLVRAGTNAAVEIPAPVNRLPLGALRDVPYDTVTFYLSPGDLLLFYTDGLNEAMSAEMAPYGDERLKASFVRHARRPLPELADELLEDIRQFTQGAEQYDDQTFVLMRIG
jgi:serine phosphatase RsbU (regulator of sigma subunit)